MLLSHSVLLTVVDPWAVVSEAVMAGLNGIKSYSDKKHKFQPGTLEIHAKVKTMVDAFNEFGKASVHTTAAVEDLRAAFDRMKYVSDPQSFIFQDDPNFLTIDKLQTIVKAHKP